MIRNFSLILQNAEKFIHFLTQDETPVSILRAFPVSVILMSSRILRVVHLDLLKKDLRKRALTVRLPMIWVS